jgi:hypothetical protein
MYVYDLQEAKRRHGPIVSQLKSETVGIRKVKEKEKNNDDLIMV